jgi:hypothetical protein
MKESLPIINIKAQSNHHALFLMLIAVCFTGLVLLFSQDYWHQYRLVLTFIYLCSLVTFITGLAKYLQPAFSLVLTPKEIKYQHRYGHWQQEWQQIQRISVIHETLGLDQIQLPYLGIRLVKLSSLNNQISPRLANRLIHEQKPLLAFAIKQKRLTLEQCQLCFDPFELPSGEILKGPLAAFFHHCTVLQGAFGYHLFLPETALDRELTDFHRLLIQCMNAAKRYH